MRRGRESVLCNARAGAIFKIGHACVDIDLYQSVDCVCSFAFCQILHSHNAGGNSCYQRCPVALHTLPLSSLPLSYKTQQLFSVIMSTPGNSAKKRKAADAETRSSPAADIRTQSPAVPRTPQSVKVYLSFQDSELQKAEWKRELAVLNQKTVEMVAQMEVDGEAAGVTHLRT